MKKQVFNPFLPSWEYIPDGEPHVFGDRLYLFGSHDRFNGTQFCMNDYVCWSAPIDDLSDWYFHGTVYSKKQDPYAKEDSIMQAPDVVRGYDGRFYLYYALGLIPFVSVAVSDNPEGPYEYYGVVKRKDGSFVGMGKHDVFMFDPGLFMDEDGKCYLYCGFGPKEEGFFAQVCQKYQMEGAYVCQLSEDMLTIKTEPTLLLPKYKGAAGTSFEGHAFYEASSMRKIGGLYYFIYSSEKMHELCYAISKHPDRDFTYGGTLVSIGDIGFNGNTTPKNYLGNTHGSLIQVNNQWYVFYHRQTNKHNYSRQACAEPIRLGADGFFRQAEITSCGLNGKPLMGEGEYPARIACNLWSKRGALEYGTASTPEADGHPYFTQTGTDREENGDQYIADMRDGATAGFKYFELSGIKQIGVLISGNAQGSIQIRTELQQEPVCNIPVAGDGWFFAPCFPLTGKSALYFTYIGTGVMNFLSFKLE